MGHRGELGRRITGDSAGEDKGKESVDDNVLVKVMEMVEVNLNESSPDILQENNELEMLAAARYVKAARAQRKLFNVKVDKCCTVTNNTINSKKVRTLVVDYGQNIELPWFDEAQSEDAYY